MTDVTLTATSATGTYTFTFLDSNIDSIESVTGISADQESFFGKAAMSAILNGKNGAVKTITISGMLTNASTTRISGYSINTIIEQKQWLESLFSGNQSEIGFTSDYESLTPVFSTGAIPPYLSAFTDTKIIAGQFRSKWTSGKNVDSLPFTLTLIVGDVII